MEAASSTAAPPSWITRRASGVLLHLSSLPSPGGIGDLGPTAHRFVDFLADAGQSWWQMLPVGPIGAGNSPYQSASSFAGNPLFVSQGEAGESSARVEYPAVREHKEGAMRRAFQRLAGEERERFDAFRATEPEWLREYTIFSAIREARGGQPWWEWPASLRDREPAALEAIRTSGFAEAVRYHEFVQFLFERQWAELAARCHARGIRLLGDLPIYVSHDSAEVWAHRDLFDLLPDGTLRAVAGVPPDYFSEDGQLWGNPLYRWDEHARRGFDWWIDRLRVTLARFDVVRIDHFIGLVNYWSVPRDARTAREGHWETGPGAAFFERVREALGGLPFLAEDLGDVTPPVTALRESLGLPGMRVLQFSLGREEDAPERYPENSAAYTGTHDNNTLVGWLGDAPERERALAHVGGDGPDVHLRFVRWLHESPSRLAVVPLQDALGLGSEARMNRPGTTSGNWEWRCRESDLSAEVAGALHAITRDTGRALEPRPAPR